MSRVLKAGATEGEARQSKDAVYDAQLAAERIIREAREEAERIRAQSAVEGRERGLAAVTELLVAARASASRTRASSGDELRVLAVRIAEKLLGRELSLRPEAVVDVAAQALDGIGAAGHVMLRCHPDDLAALERGRPRLLERLRRAQVVQIRGDVHVGRGGCVVETELATIDARLNVQLDAIERALRGDEAS